MRRMCTVEGATKAFQRVALALLIFWVPATGCGNTCVTGISNPSTGTLIVNVNSSGCRLNRANGTVRLQLGVSSIPSGGSRLPAAQHVFVSLRGIEAHPSSTADDDSPDWQELAPKLAEQPMQVDLMAPAADSCAPSSFGETSALAGTYSQIRLSLVPNRPAPSEPMPQENACGSVGFNCVVTADVSARPLVLDGGAPELRIASEHIAGGFFRVLPDTNTDLAIEFNPYASLTSPTGEAVRLNPALTVDVGTPCDSIVKSEW